MNLKKYEFAANQTVLGVQTETEFGGSRAHLPMGIVLGTGNTVTGKITVHKGS